MEVKSDGVDEEMKDDVDSVRGLLDRLKQEKERELLQQYDSSSVQENGISISDSKQNDVINELQRKQTSLVMNLKSVVKTKEPPVSSSGGETTQSDTGDNSKKRKQNSFLVEVQERAEVISKSARKAPETIVSSIGQNVEEDPDTEQFLKMIRAAPSITSEGQTENIETREHRSKSVSEVDLSLVVSSSSQLNLEPQKSKIPLGRSGSLKGRRKPTAAARRKSLKSGFADEWDDANAISEEDESMDEEETEVGSSGGSFIIKNHPQLASGSELRPRTRPKHKMKSQTVAGIALPGLAEVLSKKNAIKDNVRPQVSAAEIVRAAAEDKKNRAAKEERVEKEPEKPAWLMEAEARRKLHAQRRQNKAKQHEEMDKDKMVEDKPLNGVVLRPVAQNLEPVESNFDSNSVDLRSMAQRSEPVIGKPDSNEANILHSVVLRPVRKPEPVSTKSEDDSDVSRTTLNFCLRPVSKPGPLATETEESKDNDSVKPRNVFLRPVPKPEPVVNNDITEDSSKGKFQPVRLKPLVYAMELKSSSSKVADSGTGPMVLPTSSEEATSSKSAEVSSLGPTVAKSKAAPMKTRAFSEIIAPTSPPVKPVTQSFSYTATSSRVHEKDEVITPAVTGLAKTSPEYHIVRSLSPITSEKPTITRSEQKVVEASSSHTSGPRGGSRVTISSNYVNAPQKMAPKPKPRPSNRSKTVTVTASEVPDLSTARRTSVELIHARVERKNTRPTSTNIPVGQAASHNAKSYGDLRGPRRGSDSRDRSETFDTAYRPKYTGDVLPQWKIDLIERKKNVSALPDRPQPTHFSNSVVVPLWKKELAEKRKHRVEVSGVQTSNKENEPKTTPEIPLWKKEIAERRKRRETSPIGVQPDKIDRSPETPEWKQRLKNTRRTQPIVIPRGPSEEHADQVPSFMKEFEKKKRTFPRGGNNASYV